jgi:hypothetical protein
VGWRLLCCIKEVRDIREWWERRGGRTDGVNSGGRHGGGMREESAKESAETIEGGFKAGPTSMVFPHYFPPASPF